VDNLLDYGGIKSPGFSERKTTEGLPVFLSMAGVLLLFQ